MELPEDIYGEIGIHLSPDELMGLTINPQTRCVQQEKIIKNLTGYSLRDLS